MSMDQPRTPIACTLPPTDAARQGLEWIDLARESSVSQPLPNGWALEFPASQLSAVEDLVKREAACCAFLSFQLTHDDESIRLEVTTENPAAEPMIASLLGSAS